MENFAAKMDYEERIALALLWLRYSVFVVMFMWTLDKFIRPAHASGVFKTFYGIAGLENGIIYAIGAFEMIILIGFLLGIMKRFTYGAIMLFHGISTLSSYSQYLNPFGSKVNLLFFAAWPMLAACLALYLLRGLDTKLTLNFK